MSRAIVIPSLNPTETLIHLVESILSCRMDVRIIVVNDGSSTDRDVIFDRVAQSTGVTVLRHATNQGKGRSLKTAIDSILSSHEGIDFFITADADGQHSVADIVQFLRREPTRSLVLGVRELRSLSIPWRSWLGNRSVSFFFRSLTGVRLSDTQTGLRGFNRELAEIFSRLPKNGYDFEMQVLLECISRGIPIEEVPIKTVYVDGNESSHFHPLKDSFRVLSVLLNYRRPKR